MHSYHRYLQQWNDKEINDGDIKQHHRDPDAG